MSVHRDLIDIRDDFQKLIDRARLVAANAKQQPYTFYVYRRHMATEGCFSRLAEGLAEINLWIGHVADVDAQEHANAAARQARAQASEGETA